METTTETTSVEREIAIAASPETVWQFLERLIVAARGDDPGDDPWLTGPM